MALSKSERIEIQAAAATNVKRRIEEQRLKEQQKRDMESFIKESNERLVKGESAKDDSKKGK